KTFCHHCLPVEIGGHVEQPIISRVAVGHLRRTVTRGKTEQQIRLNASRWCSCLATLGIRTQPRWTDLARSLDNRGKSVVDVRSRRFRLDGNEPSPKAFLPEPRSVREQVPVSNRFTKALHSRQQRGGKRICHR